MTRRQAALLGGILVLSLAIVAAALLVGHHNHPSNLPALAERAQAAGWRIVPVSQTTGDLHSGFHATPPGDSRNWDALSRLLPGAGNWDGAVRCLPASANPSDPPPILARPGYEVHGEPEGVRAFAAACELP